MTQMRSHRARGHLQVVGQEPFEEFWPAARRRRRRIRLALLMAAAAVLGSGAWLLAGSLPSLARAETVLVENGVVELKWNGIVLVSRSEAVQVSPEAGWLRPLVHEEQRVAVGTPVAELEPGTAAPPPPAAPVPEGQTAAELLTALKRIQAQMYTEAEAERVARDNGQKAEEAAAAERLDGLARQEELLARRLTVLERGATAAVPATPPLRPAASGGAVPASGGKKTVLKAMAAGMVSFRVDGWEQQLAPGTAGLWNLELYDRVTGADLPAAAEAVAAGQPVFKIIDPAEVRLAAPLPAGLAAGLQVGQGAQVKLAGSTYSFRLIQLSEPVGDRALAVFAAAGLPAGLQSERAVPVELQLGRYQGQVIPARALTQREGVLGALVSEGGKTVFIPLQVVAKGGDQIVIRGLQPGQKVLLAPGGKKP